MEKMKLRLRQNIIPWLKDQLSRPQWFRNFFITRNAWASFSVYSHVRRSNGEPKISYPTKEVALKAAEKMGGKHGVHFSVYKCLYCDGWHCGKNSENKIKSDMLEEASPQSPLSIYYEPESEITYGWAGHAKSMSEILLGMSVEDEYQERNRNNIFDALLQYFLTCMEFRETLLALPASALERKELRLSKLPQRIADLYYNQLSAFRREAAKVIAAKPKAFMTFFIDAVKKDSKMDAMEWRITGGRASKLVKNLSLFNQNKKSLAKYILDWYESGKLNATPATNFPDLLSPVAFIGFSGESATGESFAICPEIFEDGYVVVKCDKWLGEGEWHRPEVIETRCSGVKVEKVHKDTIMLSLDHSLVKESLVFGTEKVSTAKTGKHVIAISEAGEFLVEIFYRKSLDAPESEDVRVFKYDFCCK